MANVHDLDALEHLNDGEEELVLGDAGYRRIGKRDELKRLDGYDPEWVTVERPVKVSE